MNNVRLPHVCKWLTMSRDQAMDKFNGLKGAFTDGIGDERFVYIEGTRDDKVLLVAHADTVWGGLSIKPDYHDGVVFSAKRNSSWKKKMRHGGVSHCTGIGIGADDRAGCSIVWRLRELGHSILITSGEEKGCIATRRLMNSDYWEKEINKHQFAVQFDRKGRNDIVFYDVGTREFAKYVHKSTGFIPQQGFSTDIKFLCKDICGVNMSVGYYDEHTSDERLVIAEYENTFAVAKEWLQQKNIPKFPFSFRDRYYAGWDDGIVKKKEKSRYIPDVVKPANGLLSGRFVACKNNACGFAFSTIQWFENHFNCPRCNTRMY